jgi:hypothetical protein
MPLPLETDNPEPLVWNDLETTEDAESLTTKPVEAASRLPEALFSVIR